MMPLDTELCEGCQLLSHYYKFSNYIKGKHTNLTLIDEPAKIFLNNSLNKEEVKALIKFNKSIYKDKIILDFDDNFKGVDNASLDDIKDYCHHIGFREVILNDGKR